MLRVLSLFTVLTLASRPAYAADGPIDWSKFATHGEISGTIVKGEANTITLEIPSLEKKSKNGDGDNGNNGNRGGKNRKQGYRVGTDHIDIPYAAPGLVRWDKMPVVPDGKGGMVKPSGKELDKLKLPIGAPGYAAERTDLKPGHLVTVQLVRPGTVTAVKATDADIVIKYVIIKGEVPAPKAAKEDPKKK